VVGLLPLHHQKGSLHSGISSRVDETVMPMLRGPQSLVCKSRLHRAEKDVILPGEVTDCTTYHSQQT